MPGAKSVVADVVLAILDEPIAAPHAVVHHRIETQRVVRPGVIRKRVDAVIERVVLVVGRIEVPVRQRQQVQHLLSERVDVAVDAAGDPGAAERNLVAGERQARYPG